jgi:hypothetical protein
VGIAVAAQGAQANGTATPAFGGGIVGRLALIVVSIWALAMISPGLYRVFVPLASFGLSVDNDGVVTDVHAPFGAGDVSPAAAAGIVEGDRVDLQTMRCVPIDSEMCDDTLALFGGLAGLHYFLPGSRLDVTMLPAGGHEARTLSLDSARPAWDGLDAFVLLASTLVGIAVVLTAAWLVWTRPGAMTWGFFAYAIWFNPGQTYTYYALITPWPLAVLAQELAEAVAQAAAYVGLLVFALRFPHDATEPVWRPVERALAPLAAGLLIVNLLSFANGFGYPTEAITRWTFYVGMVLDAGVLLILLRRRRLLAAQDEQRMRWVIAGCAIGLPAFFIAELCQSAGLFNGIWGGNDPPPAFVGMLYLLSGVLTYFVFEAVRRPRVISVSIPLRHGTVMAALTIVTAIPVFYAHEWLGHHMVHLPMPKAVWILVVGPLMVLALSQVHERAVHLAGHAFSRRYHRAQHCLEHTREALRQARSPLEVDHHLVHGPHQILGLASGAVFRRDGAQFRRQGSGAGWDEAALTVLDPAADGALFRAAKLGTPVPLTAEDWNRDGVPCGVARPSLAVPVRDALGEPLAVAVYGPHRAGNDLDRDEHAMLGTLAEQAGTAYERVEIEALRRELAELRTQVAVLSASPSRVAG